MPARNPAPFAGRDGWRRVTEGTPSSDGGGNLPQPDDSAVLASMDVTLKAILQELREQVQVGATYPLTITVSAPQFPNKVDLPNLFAVTLTNDGPGNLEYRLPGTGSGNWVALAATEQITFNAIKGVFRSIGLRPVVAGGAPVLRLVGLY